MALGSRHVGTRVVVRHLLAEPETGASATDVLGTLLAYGDELVVETADGTVVRIPRDAVVTGKPVPPRARTRLRVTTDDLQEVCAAGWVAPDAERLGGWLLRAGGGFTGRANSVLPTGDPGRSFADAATTVERWYADRDLPPLVQVVVGSRWEDDFLGAGWEVDHHGDGALVQVASVAQARRGRPTPGDVALLEQPTRGWMARYGRTDGIDPAVVRTVLTGGEQVAFAAIGGDDEPVAIGRGVVTGDWLGTAAVEVAPTHRRRGLAGRVVDALLAWGAERGARSAYLQTMPANTAALRLYEGYGFVTHHRYRYLAPAAVARSRRDRRAGPAPAR